VLPLLHVVGFITTVDSSSIKKNDWRGAMNMPRNTIQNAVIVIVVAAALVVLAGLSRLQPVVTADETVIETRTHVFTPVAEGVYHVAGTGAVNVMSNALLVVGEHDLLLVDSHVTPGAARALIDAVRSVSDKPVRYLVNTHFHFDHAHGNQVFPPEVEIIGHSYTRQRLSGELGNVLEEMTFLSFTVGVPDQIAELRRQISEESDSSRRQQLQATLAVQEAHLESLAETEPTPPNITVDSEMSIYQSVNGGGREIRIVHLGRGHTAGDVVVFLPEEKVVFTGDLMLPFLAYMGDAWVQDWPDTLEGLKALDFDVLVPGHGGPMYDRAPIDHFQAYLREFWQQAVDLHAAGTGIEEAAATIDLTAHSANYPQIRGLGADVRAIRRVYGLLDGVTEL